MAARNPFAHAESALREWALAYPGATEEFPWGERAIKVKGKVFLFLSIHEGVLRATVKLPVSGRFALTLPFAEPTGYGLGKSGWVTACFGAQDAVPVDRLCEWVDESYRAVAPKKLVAELENADESERPPRDPAPVARPARRRKRASG